MSGVHGHAFVSYVHEDRKRVDRLQAILEAAGIAVWRDTANLWPGQDWKLEIRNAITTGSLAFIACFSENSQAREKSYQREELILAVEQMRLRAPGQPWLIPVRFAECDLPDADLGLGRTLDSLQRIDLLDESWERGAARLVATVLRILRIPTTRREAVVSSRGSLARLFRYPRSRGDISCGDIRNWVIFLMLGSLAAVAAFFAMRVWPKEYNYYSGAARLDPHRFICYAVIGVGALIALISAFEGIMSPRLTVPGMSLAKLQQAANRPLMRTLRYTRMVFSLTSVAFIFSGLAGFINFSPIWCFSLAAIGGLSLISLTTIMVRHGGDALLGSVLLLLAATFIPINIDSGSQPILGLTTTPGEFATASAIIIGFGWYYYAPSPLLVLLILPTIPMILMAAYDSNVTVDPYVVLVACVSIAVSLALGANRRLEFD